MSDFVKTVFQISTSVENQAEKEDPQPKPDFAYSILRVVLHFGTFLGISSYTVQETWSRGCIGSLDLRFESTFLRREAYIIKRRKKLQIFFIVFQLIVLLYFGTRLYNLKDEVNDFELLNWLKKLYFFLMIAYVGVQYYALGLRGGKPIVKILTQARRLQKLFHSIGIETYDSRKVTVATWALCLTNLLGSIVHTLQHTQIYLQKGLWNYAWYFTKYLTLDYSTSNKEFSDTFRSFAGGITFTLETFGRSTWFFADMLHFLVAFIVWDFYRRLNLALREKILTHRELPLVVELHLKTSQLLRSCNNLLSPVIFIGILLFLAYSCLWINLMIGDYSKVYSTDKILSHTGFMQFVLRNVVLLTLSADINTKAHLVSNWLEEISSTSQPLDSKTDLRKLIIFTSQVYNKNSIGLMGLSFFVISTSFLTALLSLLLTYTVIITQLADTTVTN